MEMRFGRKFDDVRIHTGTLASESARDINAQAYTVGHQIVFRRDHYQPDSSKGRHLLAHELAHVVQQRGATRNPSKPLAMNRPTAAAELQAEQAARMHYSSSPPRLDRQELSVARSAVASASASQDTSQDIYEDKEVPSDACDWQDPDDQTVANIIHAALGGSRSDRYTINQLKLAWLDVRNQREKFDGSNCCNADLAAAEHYLYARLAVANRDHNDVEMKIGIWVYGFLLKHVYPRTGICPQSPNTTSQREWGYEGAEDGEKDLKHQIAEEVQKERMRQRDEALREGIIEGMPGQRTWRPPGGGGRVPID